jgi:CRP-like cAMP-binding protein
MIEGMESIVREHRFFADLDEATIELLAGCARNVVFRPGEYLFRTGDDANEFYLIRHGRVALDVVAPGRSAVTFQTVGPDELVGVSWLLPPWRWMHDARALDTVRAIGMDAKCLRGKCNADHDLGYEMMLRFVPVLVSRLQATRMQLLDIYGKPAA